MCVCWAGSQFNCNPKAIALALSKQKEFQIWFAFVNPKLFTKDIPNGINAVEIGSLEYYKLLATSQFILSNTRFAGGYYWPFKKRKGQYYIQTMKTEGLFYPSFSVHVYSQANHQQKSC